MIMFRALAKETDGDFGKFILNTKKPRDNAQKWRAFKNIARFFKNPDTGHQITTRIGMISP